MVHVPLVSASFWRAIRAIVDMGSRDVDECRRAELWVTDCRLISRIQKPSRRNRRPHRAVGVDMQDSTLARSPRESGPRGGGEGGPCSEHSVHYHLRVCSAAACICEQESLCLSLVLPPPLLAADTI